MRDLGIWRKPRAVNQFKNSHQDPAGQLAGAHPASERGHRAEDRGRVHNADYGDQSLGLFVEACASPLHYTAELETNLTYLVNTEQRLSFATCMMAFHAGATAPSICYAERAVAYLSPGQFRMQRQFEGFMPVSVHMSAPHKRQWVPPSSQTLAKIAGQQRRSAEQKEHWGQIDDHQEYRHPIGS
jgi:hypothetical protein